MKSNAIIKFIKNFISKNNLNENDYIIKTNIINIYKKYNIKYVAIDFSNLFYSLMNKPNYLVALINFIKYFDNNNIKPIFVFDGKPPDIKIKTTIKKRKIDRKKNENIKRKFEEDLEKIKIKELSTDDITKLEEIKKDKKVIEHNIKRYERRTHKITKSHIEEVKNLFAILKISYIDINYEADLICSYLVKNKFADACLSNDYDMLGFQCPNILREFNNTTHKVEYIDLDKICSLLKINKEQLTYLSILSGSDYSSPLFNIKISYIHDLFINKYNITEILDSVGRPNYNYKKPYDLFTKNIDFKLENINNYNDIDHDFKYIDNNLSKKFKDKIKTNHTEEFHKDLEYELNSYIKNIHISFPI